MSEITKEELEKLKELYVEQKASYKEMEEYFKVDKKQIYRWIRKHNLPRKVIHCERKTINKEELEELYVKQGKSYEEIEKHFGIKTSVLYRWIKKYDLPLRIKPTKRQLCIRQSHISGETYDASQNMPKVNKEAFEDLYVNQRKSYDEIGVYFDISRAEVYRCVKKYDLPRQIHNIQYLTNQTNFDTTMMEEHKEQAKLAIKDEYMFDFLELSEEHAERELENAMISHVKQFLTEFG